MPEEGTEFQLPLGHPLFLRFAHPPEKRPPARGLFFSRFKKAAALAVLVQRKESVQDSLSHHVLRISGELGKRDPRPIWMLVIAAAYVYDSAADGADDSSRIAAAETKFRDWFVSCSHERVAVTNRAAAGFIQQFGTIFADTFVLRDQNFPLAIFLADDWKHGSADAIGVSVFANDWLGKSKRIVDLYAEVLSICASNLWLSLDDNYSPLSVNTEKNGRIRITHSY